LIECRLDIRNISVHKRLYRREDVRGLMQRICSEEGIEGPAELSVLLCDDPFIRDLNVQYRNLDAPTDVLAFAQNRPSLDHPAVLGDIVISLESVARHCGDHRNAMREDVRLLFCHGLLHLLGYTHKTAEDRAVMQRKQAHYLGVTEEAAWRSRPQARS